uniref:Uncharacterized protein n=1 Tax=Tolypothrix bouteillei VB521301 TaxID=1479485 RepID=A0A0C1NDL7_9CYAN
MELLKEMLKNVYKSFTNKTHTIGTRNEAIINAWLIGFKALTESDAFALSIKLLSDTSYYFYRLM